MKVTIFGGSAPQPGDPPYEEARILGEKLAKAGHIVLTGGYMGTMEAVSRGANEAGGYVIGVTSKDIESWRDARPNDWVLEERSYEKVRDRLYGLIDDCDAALALPGGIGTLAEIAVMWSELQTASISPKPLILIGPGWKATFEALLHHHPSYIPEPHRPLISFAPDIDAAIQRLQELR